jgi:hypothetical protein
MLQSQARYLGLIALGLAWQPGCGRVGVDLLPMEIDNVCVASVCSSDVDRCLADAQKNSPGICGCGISDEADVDMDGTPDCADMCAGGPDRLGNGKCGCAAASQDGDGDGIVNCHDQCPYDGGKQAPLICGCGASEADSDGDRMPDCADACPHDTNKVVAGSCGCGVAESESNRDSDMDGTPDCIDLCNGVDDARYVPDLSCGTGYCRQHNTPSSCAAGLETACQAGLPLSSSDATCDGVDDDCDGVADEDFASSSTTCGAGACAGSGAILCTNGVTRDTCTPRTPAANDATCGVDDDCDGTLDEDFVPYSSSCGTGVCATSGMVTCVSGSLSDSCKPGAAGANDATCNNVDEDCNGTADEDFVPAASSCGLGVCRASGTLTCAAGKTADSCVPGTPASTVDGPPANGVDDDCDGQVDENACGAGTLTFGPGLHNSIAVPGGCGTVSVQLWGGGGGSGGKPTLGSPGMPGSGGAGGYAGQSAPVSGALALYVGEGGTGCGAGGVNAGSPTYNGGLGAAQGANGTAGADGMVGGGGAGGGSGTGFAGGRGYYGGGGGGSGMTTPFPIYPDPGRGGGGGAATILLIGGTRTVVAGGGGGGGGADGSLSATQGGAGGEGCAGPGGTSAGGGGGGGVCVGTATTRGTTVTPANSGLLPAGRATGGSGDCASGGGGYAIVTFAP